MFINGIFPPLHAKEVENESEMMIAICQERNYIKLSLLFYAAKLSNFRVPFTHETSTEDSRESTGRKKSLNWPQKIESVLKSLLCGTERRLRSTVAKECSTFETSPSTFQHIPKAQRLF